MPPAGAWRYELGEFVRETGFMSKMAPMRNRGCAWRREPVTLGAIRAQPEEGVLADKAAAGAGGGRDISGYSLVTLVQFLHYVHSAIPALWEYNNRVRRAAP